MLIKESECGGMAWQAGLWSDGSGRVLESDHGGAPSYTNICPQSAGRPVNRSEYQNINLSPSYGREGEGRREGQSLLHFIVSSCQQPIL